jgi:3-isopropylmalate/(R)-2-methylmalate dehydratase large subunit
MVAKPHHPTNGIPVDKLNNTKITKVFVGSCTGGSYSDIKKVAEILKKVSRIKVPLTIQPSTIATYKKLYDNGYLDILKNIGATILFPACGACCGMGPGGVDEKTDIILSTTNRNFYGRMGKKGGKIYLCGAKTAAYSAITGKINNKL